MPVGWIVLILCQGSSWRSYLACKKTYRISEKTGITEQKPGFCLSLPGAEVILFKNYEEHVSWDFDGYAGVHIQLQGQFDYGLRMCVNCFFQGHPIHPL